MRIVNLRIHLPVLFLLFTFFNSYGTTVSGIVNDEKDQPLPYAAVYIKGTTIGTATNLKGFYLLNLDPGSYTLVFQMIGYKKHFESITVSSKPVIINVRLFPEEIILNEVVVKAEDPAYPIMRQAIARKAYYLDQIPEYQCRVFTKSVFRITNAPAKIFGNTILEKGDSLGGIFYLSEAESRISFQHPDKIKEVMVSSKVSGDNQGFSFNFYSFFMLSFYKNLIVSPLGNQRGYVSPLSDNAFFYYKFKLEGSFMEGNVKIFKIRVIPKRETDPVFSGDIYIQDNTYRLHLIDLMLGKGAKINFVDSMKISQQYLPVNDTTWMIFSQKIHFFFSLDFFGKKFAGNGVFLSQNTDYTLDVKFPKDFFRQEVIRINKDANKKDSVYWEENRHIPLTEEEQKNYVRRDSLIKKTNSKEYLDSVDRRNNRLRYEVLWNGYRHYKRNDSLTHFISSPLFSVQFNTVQGWNLSLYYYVNKMFRDQTNIFFRPQLAYGFSDKTFRGNARLFWRYDRDNFGTVSLEGGVADIRQFNGTQPILPLINSLYSVIGELNYLKIYARNYARLSLSTNLFRGFSFNGNIEISRRMPLINHFNSPVTDISQRRFTSNDPRNADNFEPSFQTHNAIILGLSLSYTIGQKVAYLPFKTFLGSKYPTLTFSLKQGIPDILGSKTEFTQLQTGITHHFRAGLFGNTSFMVMGGAFVDKYPTCFIDCRHFDGNRTLFSTPSNFAFQLMDYYSNSARKYWVDGFLEHHFNGWLINKIPLLKKTKLREILSLRYLTNDAIRHYWEAGFGIDNIFKVIRVDFNVAFEGDKLVRNGVVLRIPIISSNGIEIQP
ncbi:MAG: DUF5686 and carboxypeptidase regulatory-like domain-containing protein [Bacteroidetes bacterium]|nr:DUF5686 and carboxypeptidase regulatory-like domain-containing protein [Bacteroidota bacterium]